MKAIISTLLMGFFTSYFYAQTSGSLTVEVTTSSAGGNYSPKNIVAIWVEDSNGKFVKTLMAYADRRQTHLNTWEAATTNAGSAFNKVDAVSGATRSNHAKRQCTWNGTNYKGQAVADGTYKLWMELTDKNSTGNKSSFTFVKGTAEQKLNPANVPSFSAISINWLPVFTSAEELESNNDVEIYPNPARDKVYLGTAHKTGFNLYDLTGKLVLNSSENPVSVSHLSNGMYVYKLTCQGEEISGKLLKK